MPRPRQTKADLKDVVCQYCKQVVREHKLRYHQDHNRKCIHLREKKKKEQARQKKDRHAVRLLQEAVDRNSLIQIHNGRSPIPASASILTGITGPQLPRTLEDLQHARQLDDIHDDLSNAYNPPDDDSPDQASSTRSHESAPIPPWLAAQPICLPAATGTTSPTAARYETPSDFISFPNQAGVGDDGTHSTVSIISDPQFDEADSHLPQQISFTVEAIMNDNCVGQLAPITIMGCANLQNDTEIPLHPVVNVRRDHKRDWQLWQQPKYAPKRDVAYLELTNLLESRGCSHIMFEEILGWAEGLVEKGIMDHKVTADLLGKTKRRTFINRIMQLFPTPKFHWQVVPMETKATQDFLHGSVWFMRNQQLTDYYDRLNKFERTNRDCVWVPKTDFAEQLLHLLSDRTLFGCLDNLVINRSNMPDSIYQPYETKNGDRLDEVLSGSWYRDTIRRMKAGPNDFLIPIIIYLDKTGTDAYQRYGLEPVIFTVGILNRTNRNKSSSWRCIGFIPDLELRSKAEKNRDRSGKMKGTSNRNYQQILRVVLESLVKYQRTGIDHELCFGRYRKKVKLWPKVCFVMGDAKSGDTLTGRYGTHDKLVRRQSRHCLTMYNDLDSHCTACPMIQTYQLRFPIVLSYGDTASETASVDGGAAIAIDSESSDDELSNDALSQTSVLSDVALERRRVGRQQESNTNNPSDVVRPSSHRKRKASTSLPPANRAINRQPGASCRRGGDSSCGVAYKTAPMPADKLLSTHKLLDHSYILQLLQQRWDSMALPPDNHVLSGCDQMSADDSDYVWKLYQKKYKSATEAKEVLQLLGQHQSMLAFHEIDFGGDATGINGGTPTDVMHSMKLGLLRYVAKWTMDLIKPKHKAVIDELAHAVIARQRQTERRYFPRSDYSHSLTGVSMLTAEEWVGVVMTTSILLQTNKGRSAFTDSKPKLPESTTVDTVINMLEMLLSCLSWLSSGPFWIVGDNASMERAVASVDKMIENMVINTPRTEGNGWCIIKLHELRHICSMISKFGAPSNWDSGTGERNLKDLAKNPAKTAQMRGYRTFLQQVVQRSMERSSLQMAQEDWRVNRHNDWQGDNENDPDQLTMNTARVNGGTKVVFSWPNGKKDTMSIPIFIFHLHVHPHTGRAKAVMASHPSSRVYRPSAPVIDTLTKHVVSHVLEVFRDVDCSANSLVKVEIEIFSEANLKERYIKLHAPPGIDSKRYTHVTAKGLTLRCHPNYGQEGPWNDWIVIRRPGTSFPSSVLLGVPSRILAMATWKLIEMGADIPKDAADAFDEAVAAGDDVGDLRQLSPVVVLHSSERFVDSTVLTERWELKYQTITQHVSHLATDASVEATMVRPVLTVEPVYNIIDRVMAFTEVRNIVDDFPSSQMKNRKHVLVVKDKERFWGSEFTAID